MPTFPLTPVPSQISAPALIDPVLRFQSDAQYEYRRALASRPRRRYTMEWKALTTTELRILRDFVLTVRGGALTFDWFHTTAADPVTVTGGTPVILTYQHSLVTGQWLWVHDFSGVAVTPGMYHVTRLNGAQVSLNGTSAGGSGTGYVNVYLPTAVLILASDTMESATKHIGPEAIGYGRFAMQLVVEEVF